MSKKLFLINGTAGVGKSTFAKKLHNSIPFSLYISVDEIKFSISHFENDNDRAIGLALKLALNMSELYLEKGYSVIVDRMIWGGYKSIGKMKNIAEEKNAKFEHILLKADLKEILKRADERGYNNFGKGTQTPEKITLFSRNFEKFPPENVTLEIDTTSLDSKNVWNQYQKSASE